MHPTEDAPHSCLCACHNPPIFWWGSTGYLYRCLWRSKFQPCNILAPAIRTARLIIKGFIYAVLLRLRSLKIDQCLPTSSSSSFSFIAENSIEDPLGSDFPSSYGKILVRILEQSTWSPPPVASETTALMDERCWNWIVTSCTPDDDGKNYPGTSGRGIIMIIAPRLLQSNLVAVTTPLPHLNPHH